MGRFLAVGVIGALAAAALAAAVAVAAAPVSAQAQRARPLPDETIVVQVTGLRNDAGRVLCALYRGPDGFPTEPEKIFKGALARPRNGVATCRFDGVPMGMYAVAVLHDEDSDGAMARGLFGIPTEGYGASNDARGTFGPPAWEDARFGFDGSSRRLRVRIQY